MRRFFSGVRAPGTAGASGDAAAPLPPAALLVPAILTAVLLAVLPAGCAWEPELPERFALIYGVADYPVNPLKFPDDDAQALHGLFLAKGFSPDGTILRTNAAATKTQLEADIDALAARAGRNSLFVFYFSGHGGQDSADGPEPPPQDALDEYIYLYDGDGIQQGGLRDDELMARISRIPSRQKVVIIDACNSGGFIGWSPGVDTVPPDYGGYKPGALAYSAEAFARYFARPRGGDIPYDQAIVITAAGERESSYDGDDSMKHGVFTYYLLQTPRRGDLNGDGFVTATEAYGYVKKQIDGIWNLNQPGARFFPRISGGALDFVLFEAD